MKKIINGAKYDTTTAKRLGIWENGYSRSDFNYCSEDLYQTKSGKYFLHGEGGPMSKYSQSCGNNSWTGGQHIEPLTPAAAREWAEEHLDADAYCALFGEPEEASDGREALTLTLPSDIKRALENMRAETGKSISQIVTDMVRNA